MSSHRGQISANDIREGNIIQFVKGVYGQSRGRGTSYGYVHHVMYETDNDDTAAYFSIFEIVPREIGSRSGKRLFNISENQPGNPYGLPPNKDWVIVIDPQRLDLDQKSLGTSSDHLVQRLGHIGATQDHDRLLEIIDEMGGDSSIYYGDGRTGYSTSRVWDLGGIPVTRDRGPRGDYDPDKAEERKYRRGSKARNVRGFGILGAAKPGEVLDLKAEYAPQAVGLDQRLVEAFTQPANPKLKQLEGLREIFMLADKKPEELLPYVEHLIEADDITLAEAYERGYFEGVMDVEGLLSAPREGHDVQPITHLLQLEKILDENPDYLLNFYGVGQKTIQNVRAEVTIAVANFKAERATSQTAQASLKDITQSIKTAWGSLTQDYLDIRKGKGDMPEKYIGADGEPVIFLRADGPK